MLCRKNVDIKQKRRSFQHNVDAGCNCYMRSVHHPIVVNTCNELFQNVQTLLNGHDFWRTDNPEGQWPMWATHLHTRAMFNIWHWQR